MDSLSSEIFNILKYLLPGFVSAWIFHSFTSYPKQAQFERIIQALIFTAFIQGCVMVTKPLMLFIGKYWSLGSWSGTSHLFWSYGFSVLIGFTFSTLANNDRFHTFLRDRKITKERSYHCEWFSTFKENETFVILHLKDERRIFGWPTEWSSDPTKGHVILQDPSWVTEDGYQDMPTVKLFMISVSDIKWVEFLQEEKGVNFVE
ncbi:MULTISPECIES: DUF6338 family protein [Yersinia]|uniref:DUF6338 family protein n=1 Tax=Yersinia TaxID=629 RepID=UPI0005E8AD99|nr:MULTISPECIES: DUF6338 family protein [Yersinia]CNE40980.1 Uncharacterised protein [Yersinia intermedia]CNI91103.1 Uncharacterised protein [Yersinia enterocolitica]